MIWKESLQGYSSVFTSREFTWRQIYTGQLNNCVSRRGRWMERETGTQTQIRSRQLETTVVKRGQGVRSVNYGP